MFVRESNLKAPGDISFTFALFLFFFPSSNAGLQKFSKNVRGTSKFYAAVG